ARHRHGFVRAALRCRARVGDHLHAPCMEQRFTGTPGAAQHPGRGALKRQSRHGRRNRRRSTKEAPYWTHTTTRMPPPTKPCRAEARIETRKTEPRQEHEMSAVLDPHDHAHDDHHHTLTGWRRWVYATNHKDIGTMYLTFALFMFFFGGINAMLLRAELFQPGLQIVQPETFNQLTTMHGLLMVFGAIMPAWVGFANWMIPLQIGASDMAFARMNNFSFWLLPAAAVLLVVSYFVPGGAPAAGWTVYAPLSTQMGPGMDLGIFALHIMGASSIMGSINIIVTVLNMRAPGMTLMKMPMFCWTWLITAYLLLAVMPVLAG